MTMLDDGVASLLVARRALDKAHKAACAAMARFDAVNSSDIMTADERVAARSLLFQTVPLCKAILCAMQDVPEAASLAETGRWRPLEKASSPKPKACNRGIVARSARNGRPILTAIAVLLVISYPLSGKSEIANRQSAIVERVIDALVQIESGGRPAVTGDQCRAVGLLQLHPVAMREANRIAGSNRWKLSDRFCPQKSRAMARTILTWHYRRGVTDPVELACRWNKPFGQTTAHYRAKVKATLAKI